jgi:hypothetical protein
MGGVIVRRAVLNELQAQGAASPCSGARLRLFAPAQAGFRQHAALGTAMSTNPVTGLGFALMLLSNRAFNDLMPGSPILGQLERDHIAMAAHPSRTALVAWAKGDYVVFDTIFPGDTEVRIPGKDHRSVCKPRADYLDPLDIVLK